MDAPDINYKSITASYYYSRKKNRKIRRKIEKCIFFKKNIHLLMYKETQ